MTPAIVGLDECKAHFAGTVRGITPDGTSRCGRLILSLANHTPVLRYRPCEILLTGHGDDGIIIYSNCPVTPEDRWPRRPVQTPKSRPCANRAASTRQSQREGLRLLAPLLLPGPGSARARGPCGPGTQKAWPAPGPQTQHGGDGLSPRAVVAGALAARLGAGASSPAAFRASGASTQHRAGLGSTGKKTPVTHLRDDHRSLAARW